MAVKMDGVENKGYSSEAEKAKPHIAEEKSIQPYISERSIQQGDELEKDGTNYCRIGKVRECVYFANTRKSIALANL